MLRQIRIHPADADYQRIFWRYTPNSELSSYRLLTVTYATASAPFLANRVLKQLARDEGANYPLAVAVLEEDVYVNDLLFGAENIVLLQQAPRIFDLLGWVAPVTISSKILMQALWLRKVEWDDPLEDDLLKCCLQYQTQLLKLNGAAIPRWTGQGSESHGIELYGYADASNLAYAAVIYLRVESFLGQVQVSLLYSKTKVAPLKVQNYNKMYRDSHCKKPSVYKEGDYVLIRDNRTKVGINTKLKPKYKGSYQIAKNLGNNRYVIKDIPGFNITQKPLDTILSSDKIKPWVKHDISVKE
ncbi:hypothetical protein RF55_8222 [Lasius niger]|uniref:Uncharacterized protein n=1 Tax=Lasius niger TaxID=67767 RepID=A0A0J7KNA5_LASNI|nr:hypothetical protein RF55_8222 [Lasius niger]